MPSCTKSLARSEGVPKIFWVPARYTVIGGPLLTCTVACCWTSNRPQKVVTVSVSSGNSARGQKRIAEIGGCSDQTYCPSKLGSKPPSKLTNCRCHGCVKQEPRAPQFAARSPFEA